MKKTLLSAATALALTLSGSLSAGDDRRCLDDACDTRVLFTADDDSTGGGATQVILSLIHI